LAVSPSLSLKKYFMTDILTYLRRYIRKFPTFIRLCS
jgi:hypothetical protein